MMKQLKPVAARQVRMFKIANRRGYAAVCFNNLTEGASPLQAYQRMSKAVRRIGGSLPELSAADASRLVVSRF